MSHKYSASDLKLNLGNSENSGEHTRRLLQEYRNVLSQYMPTTLNTPPVRQSINRPSTSQSDTVLPSTPTNFQNFTSPIISSFQSTNYAMESPSLSESNYASREQIDTRSTSVPYVTDFSNNSIRYKNSPKTSPYVQNDSLVSDNEEIGNLQDRLLNLQRERLKEQSENENAKKDMSGRIRFLEDTVSKLNNTIDNLQDKNTSMNEFISTTKERADYLEKSKKDVEEENKSVLEKVQKLEHELRDERERSMMSDGSLDVYHAQILNLQKENQQLQDALQQEYNAKDNDQIALLHQNSILEGRVNQEMEEVEFHRKSFEKASFANDELRRENEILLHQMRKIQRDLDVEFERHEEKEKSLRTDLETAAQSFELIHQDKAAILNELNATVANLREENEQLSSALKNMTKDQISHHEALQKEAQKHVSDVQVLNRKITQVQDELRDSQTINAKLNSALQDKQRELSLKSEKIVVLTEQFADMERQYKNLLDDSYQQSRIQSPMKGNQNLVEHLANDKLQLQQENDELSREIGLLKNDNEDLQMSVATLTGKLSSNQTIVLNLTTVNENLKAELKKAVDELQAALLERELGVNESNQSRLKTATLQTEKLTSELSKKVQDSLEEEVKVHELTAQLEEEIRKGKEMSRNVQQLKQDLAKDREKHDRRIQDVEAEKKQIETAAVNLKNENDKLERELRLMRDSKQEQWQDLEARYQSYIATITELEQEVANQKEIKQKELESNQRVLTEVKRTIKDLERDLQQANRDAEIAAANAEEKEKQLQEAREDHETQLIELDEELKKLKSSNDVLRDAAANHQRMLRMQRQEFDEATKATADHYESRINEVIAAKRNVDNKFKQLQTEMLELSEKHQQDLDAVSAELRDKDDHLREITSDLFAVKEVSVSLTNNFNALVQELKTINEDVSLSEQNLSEQMKLLKQELFSLASENTTLHKRNDNLQEKMEQLVRETRLAEDEASILMTHRDKLDRTCATQAAQIKQLQDKLKASVDELTKDRDARVIHLQKQELQLRESNELLRSQNQIHLDELEDLRMLKVDLNERNNALADELEDTKRSAHDRINDLNSTITKLNKAIVALKQRADSANSMNESQEKSNNERVQQLEAQVEEWQHKCEEAKKAVELQELQTKHVDNEWKHKFAAINEHIQSIEQAVREQDRRNEEDRHILQKKIQEKADRIQELEQEMSVRRSGDEHNIRSKLEQMKDLKTQLALSERAKKQMQASLETMQEENEQVRQRFSQITQEIEEVKRERDDLITQVTMLHDEMDAIRHAHYRHDNSSKDSISHLHDQLAQKDQLVNNLNEQRKTLQQEKAKLATKMEEIALQYRKTIDELKAEIEQTRSTREVSLDGSAKEKRDFDQQITAVRNEVQQLQSERKGLYEQLLAQKQLVEQHKATIRKLEHQFVEAIELRNSIASPVKGSPARASKEELSLASENERLKQELTSLRKGVGNSKLLDHEVGLLRQEKTKLTEQLMGQNLKSENLEQQLRQMNRRYEEAERERRLVADTYSHQVNALQRSNTDMHQYVMRTPSPKTPKRR